MKTLKRKNTWPNWPGLILLTLLGLLLSGCFHGQDQALDSDSDDTGELVIGLTDAEGDFIRYAVDVTSLSLTRANGAVVETLPQNTTVDFAQYVDMTEFLTAAQVPLGTYTHAILRMDYGQADIQVEDANGDAAAVTSIEDSEGNPITSLEVTVNLEDRSRLIMLPGVPAHLNLDFDLKSSNQVVFEGSETRLIVEPVLLAELDPEKPKIHRLRGPLKEVNVEDKQFSVYLRPFVHSMADRQRHFGVLDVDTSSSTVYDIDGVSYEGSEGLQALAALPSFSAVVAIGDVQFNPRRFSAREVYAGSSVPGGSLDVVRGHVIARLGDTLTVKGATLIRAGGSIVFSDQVTVTLADSTVVRRQRDRSELDIDAISIGQKLSIFGSLTNEQAGQLELDASNGRARLLYTRLRGNVVSLENVSEPTAPLVLDLQSIDRRASSLFDFSGTGAEPGLDADPDNYEIATGSLSLTGLTSGSPLLAFGFASAFGTAPADFNATSLVDVAAVRAVMAVNWQPASATAFSSPDETGMTLNLEGAGRFQHIVRSGVRTPLSDLGSSPRIEPESDQGVYVIRSGDSRQLHTSFAQFVDDLQTQLENGEAVAHINANGNFDDDSAVLSANRIKVSLN